MGPCWRWRWRCLRGGGSFAKLSMVPLFGQCLKLWPCCSVWWILCCLFAEVIADSPACVALWCGPRTSLPHAINEGRRRRGETRLSWQMFQGKIYLWRARFGTTSFNVNCDLCDFRIGHDVEKQSEATALLKMSRWKEHKRRWWP